MIEPLGDAWNFVVPRPVQRALDNVSENLWIAAVVGSHLLQLRVRDALVEDLPRLIVNTTLGIAGLFDVSTGMGIEENYTDFGVTVGAGACPRAPISWFRCSDLRACAMGRVS